MVRMRRGSILRFKGFGAFYAKLSDAWERYGVIITIVLVLIASGLAFWLRLGPYINVVNSGIASVYPFSKLYEMDPFINYWLTDYLDKHGPLSWSSLTQNNPATCIFWYPYCRDIAHSELLGHIYTMYVVYEIVKPFGVKLIDLEAIFPPLLAAIAVIGIALLIYEVSDSLIASIIGAFSFAGIFIDRTMAGFTVKYSFGICLAPIALWLHFRFLKRRGITLAIISGLFLAYLTSVWAGFSLTIIPIVFSLAFAPLIVKDVRQFLSKRDLVAVAIEMLIPSILPALIPYYSVRGFFMGRLGVLFLLGLVAFLVGTLLRYKLGFWKTLAIYVCASIALGFGTYWLILLHKVHVAGKVAIALGLPAGRLPHTVAEYQPISKGSIAYLSAVSTIMIAIFVGVPTALLSKDDKKRLCMLSMAVWGIVASIATLRVAYFSNYTLFACVTYLSALAGHLFTIAKPEVVCFGTRCRFRIGFYRAVAMMLLVPVLTPCIYLPATMYDTYGYQMTTIATAEGSTVVIAHGKPVALPTTAWLSTLSYIREHTPKDSVILAWWDYGYWISVAGARASVADGSTINATQISIIAKFFTSPLNKSVYILKDLGLCNTKDYYVLVYGTVYVNIIRNTVYFSTPLYVMTIPLSFGDIPKFIAAIVYIATGIDPIADIVHGNYIRVKSIGGTLQIVSDPHGWVEAILGPGPAGLELYALYPDWSKLSKDEITLPYLFAYGAFKVLHKLYPGYNIKLANTIFLPARGGIYAISNENLIEQLGTFTDKQFNQSEFKLVYAGVSQPISMGKGFIYRYVLVLLFKISEDTWRKVCLATK